MSDTKELSTKFELFLLGQMAGSQLARGALNALGSTETTMMAATDELLTAGFGTPGHRASLYVDWLGPAASTSGVSQAGAGFGRARELKFDLSVWPNMQFRVFEHVDGWAFDAGFTRRESSSVPHVDYSTDLAPWQLLRSEIEARFGRGRSVDGWNSRSEVIFNLPDLGTRQLRAHRLVFDFDLLQVVEHEQGS